MNKFILFFLLMLSVQNVFSQEVQVLPVQDTTVYTTVDILPSYPGGDTLMQAFITENFRYPVKKTRGEFVVNKSVNVNFIITEKGEIQNVQNTEATQWRDETADEILRIIKLMPVWNPGILNGKKVNTRIYYNVSMVYNKDLVVFKLINISDYNQRKIQYNHYFDSGLENIKLKDYECAVDNFSCCLLLFPYDIDARFNRAAIWKKLGNMNGACNDWKLIKLLESSDADELIRKYCDQ